MSAVTEIREKKNRRWAVWHGILIGVPIVFVVALALTTGYRGVPRDVVLATRWVLIPVTLIWLFMFVFVVAHHLSVVANGVSDDQGVPVDLAEVDEMFGVRCPGGLSADQVLTFLGCVVAPKQFFEKIAESVESCHRSIVLTSAFTLHLREYHVSVPGETVRAKQPLAVSAVDYVVPLVLPKKKASRHGIQVSDSEGHSVSILSVRDLHLYTAAVLRYVIWIASPQALEEYLQGTITVESAVWKQLVKSDATDADVKEAQAYVRRLPATGTGAELLNAVADAIGELSDRRPIAIAVPESVVFSCQWPSTLRYTVERRFIPPAGTGPSPAANAWQSLGERARLILGVSPDRCYVPLDAAYRTNNYNLEVLGPEGTYFAGGALDLPEDVTFRATLQPRQGQRRSHLSLRRLSGKFGAPKSESFYLARFSERSPGSLANASIAAATSTVLIVVLFIISASTNPIVLGHARTVAFGLVALPVAMATFVGLATSGARRRPSLTSRFVTFSTAVLSLCAFVLAVFRQSPISTNILAPARSGLEGLWWNNLVWMSLSVTAISVVSWFVRLSVEHHAIRGGGGTEGRDFSSSDVTLTH